MKRLIGAVLLLAAMVILGTGGPMLGSSLSFLLSRTGLTPQAAVFAIAGACASLFGSAALWGGLRLCRNEADENAAIEPWKVLAWGLLFPGSAQAYGGRWKEMVLFLMLPWILVWLLLLLSVFASAAQTHLGTDVKALHDFFVFSVQFFKPGRVFYGSLWLLSLAEGYRWAVRLKGAAPIGRIPRWRASVIGLGAICFFCVPFLLFSLFMVGQVLKTASVLKGI